MADEHSPETARPNLLRASFAEAIAAFFLTLVSAGGEAVAARSDGVPSQAARGIASGLVIVALVHALSAVSGAHKNPGITLAFALRGAFPWCKVPFYWLAQILGAILAAVALRVILGPGSLGESEARMGAGAAFGAELVFSLLLYSVALATAHRKGEVGPHAALAVGSAVAIAAIVAGPISGGSLNPARSLGPALVSGHLDDIRIYIAAPFLASALAAGLVALLYPSRHPEEHEAAQGKPYPSIASS